jgi:hypothetical protein
MTYGGRDPVETINYMAQMNFAHAHATRALGSTVAQLVQIVDALADHVDDPARYHGLKGAVQQARMSLMAGQAQVDALVQQADAMHYYRR